ncbi:MAG: hypothetical protein SNJ69_07190 [Chloroflexaceae bacterium]
MLLVSTAMRWKRWIVLLPGVGIFLLIGACGAAPAAPVTPSLGVTPSVTPAPPGAPAAYPAPGGAPTAYPGPVATPSPAAQAPPLAPTATPAQARPPMARVTPTGAPPPLTGLGEVPASKVAAAIADLAQRTGADPGAITIVSAEAVTWNDGALGCPQPGMAYTQALVDGYRLILSLNGVTYAYHAAVRGDFFYCERPAA